LVGTEGGTKIMASNVAQHGWTTTDGYDLDHGYVNEDAAQKFGTQMARKLVAARIGELRLGGRVILSEQELATLFKAAFDCGVKVGIKAADKASGR